MKTPILENLGSLITYKDENGQDRCLGALWYASEHGTYDAEFGKVDVTPEQADAHNKQLELAMLKGLDENCAIGQGGSFYAVKREGRTVITTFNGTLVSDAVSINGQSLTFRRGAKVYRGRLSRQHDLFNFRRVA